MNNNVLVKKKPYVYFAEKTHQESAFYQERFIKAKMGGGFV